MIYKMQLFCLFICLAFDATSNPMTDVDKIKELYNKGHYEEFSYYLDELISKDVESLSAEDKARLDVLVGISLAKAEQFERSSSWLEAINNELIDSSYIRLKNQTLAFNYSELGNIKKAVEHYHYLIDSIDPEISKSSQLRKKIGYYAILVNLFRENKSFEEALAVTNAIKLLIPKCQELGLQTICAVVFNSSIGKLYADMGDFNSAETNLIKAKELYETRIYDYKNNENYLDIISYLNK